MPRNLVFITYDSCRLDSALAAKAPNLNRLGEIEARWSYASWTAPSHYAYMMGLVPHKSPPHVYASDVYKEDFRRWTDRLEIPRLQFETFLPELSLPAMLRKQGYRNFARVSMPVLNPFTGINRAFDDYKLMPNHNDFAGMVKEIAFSETQPAFWFLNLGETHYPYMLKDAELPHISGLHGVTKALDADRALQYGLVNAIFDTEEAMLAAALHCAAEIASKPPVAIWGTKQAIHYARDHSVDDSLKQMGWLQGAIWSNRHVMESVKAMKTKGAGDFPALQRLTRFVDVGL